MLHLLTHPRWAPEGESHRDLPPLVPAALLVVLACQGGWVDRQTLAAIFWPDEAHATALHRLRINLHRSRQLLAAWGTADSLRAERSRLRLVLPSDVAALRAAEQANDAAALARLSPRRWLQSWRLPGYEGFAEWCEQTGQQLQDDWLAAHRRATGNDGTLKPANRQAGPADSTLSRVEALAEGGHQALPRGPGADAEAPPGRAAEMQRLRLSSAPATLLLGEPGAGKTTLLAAAYPAAPCLRGLEGLHAMPYRPLLDTLREHIVPLERALRQPGHPARPYRLDLARLLPELAPDEALPPLDALTAKTRQVEALVRAFEALTPVLLIDDLQWCDAATVEWLLLLAYSGRLRWRAAARRHEIGPVLQEALQSLRAVARLEELDVPALDRAALALACQARWPQDEFGAARLDRLHALSGGNPFLLGELVAAGLTGEDEAATRPVLERVGQLVRARMAQLPAQARRAVEAAAVFVKAAPAEALRQMAGTDDAPIAEAGAAAWSQACAQALAAGMLREESAGLVCRHDLIRGAVAAGLDEPRRAGLHRKAALWLAAQPGADALTVADHWRAALEPQTALAWRHRGAEQLKARGRFDEARALWHEVAADSLDAAQALRARLELAACDLFDDLARGRAALEAVHAQLSAVADPALQRQIEGRALSALVDNRVFAGDIAAARGHARRLRELLAQLPPQERVDAIEVLIELAMREPDIPGAWALLAQLRAAAPRRPTLLSFEGQIHWFGGQVQAAHDALARLLEQYPDFCGGLTIENDLAVMLQALGHIEAAEIMARRSLQSWSGVAHTETLSLLVLGLVLTSAGRHDEADAALERALLMAREQASPGFEAEALVRRARLQLQCGRGEAALETLQQAEPLLRESPEPLRVSQLVLAQVLAAQATGRPQRPAWLARLRAAAERTEHPLVQVRLARVQVAAAMAEGRWSDAATAAAQQAERAQHAGLREPLVEALLLQLRARQLGGAPAAGLQVLAEQAALLARQQGFAPLLWRAQQWQALHGGAANGPRYRTAATQTLQCLIGAAAQPLFDPASAAKQEPGWSLVHQR